MEFLLHDFNKNPKNPLEARINSIKITPWDDHSKISIILNIDETTEPLNIEIKVKDENGNSLVTTSIVGNKAPITEFTMHMPEHSISGNYKLSTTLFYLKILDEVQNGDDQNLISAQLVDEKIVSFTI
jgi:hypothetical protein